MNRLTLILLLSISLSLMVACGGQPTPAPATPLNQAETRAIETPTATPLPPTATPTISPAAAATAVSAMLMQHVPPTPVTNTENSGIEGITVFTLTNPIDQNMWWIAHTHGFLNYEIEQKHLVGLYKPVNGAWQEVNVLTVESEPSMVAAGSVESIKLDEENLWLMVDSFTGAHSGCFDVLHFNKQQLGTSLSHCNSSPGAAEVKDVDHDGKSEIILNKTDYYVFCYACGVQHLDYQTLHWDGTRFQTLTFTMIMEAKDTQLRDMNNEAVKLAQAELWKEAANIITQAVAVAPQNPTVQLNAALITRYADEYALRLQQNETGYPLLTQVFYGDYDAALALMRPHTPADIFNSQGPLIVGTPAEGWLENLQMYLNARTTAAIAVKPDLAAAYFLRGWSNYLVDAQNPTIVTDLQKAAELQPTETLFSESLSLVQN